MGRVIYTSMLCGAFVGCLISPSFTGMVCGALVMTGLTFLFGKAAMTREWQPIETAPKTGDAVLLCNADEQDSTMLLYYDETENANYPWQAVDDSNTAYPIEAFTHWTPLPEQPKG